MHAHSVAKSCPTLCDPIDCSPPGSSVHGILLARILECVAISFSRESSQTKDWTQVSCIGKQILYHWAISSVQFSSVSQSCPTLWNPMDCSMPALPVHHQLRTYHLLISRLDKKYIWVFLLQRTEKPEWTFGSTQYLTTFYYYSYTYYIWVGRNII